MTGNRRCGLGESVPLGVGFGVSNAQAQAVSSLLPGDLDVEVSAASPAAHLPVCCHGNRLNLWNCKPVPTKRSPFIRVAVVKMSLHSQKNGDQDSGKSCTNLKI